MTDLTPQELDRITARIENGQIDIMDWTDLALRLIAAIRERDAKLADAERAISAFDVMFNRYGEKIESDDWQTEGPPAWVELVLAMDELRAALDRIRSKP